MKLHKYRNINKNTTEIIKNKQPSYGSIYNLSLIELKILKTYIKIHL